MKAMTEMFFRHILKDKRPTLRLLRYVNAGNRQNQQVFSELPLFPWHSCKASRPLDQTTDSPLVPKIRTVNILRQTILFPRRFRVRQLALVKKVTNCTKHHIFLLL